jgi:hypothetical protein
MTRTYFSASVAASALLIAAACSSKPAPNPASPTVNLSELRADAAADGSTLKATAPAPQSPINGTKPSEPPLRLVASNAQVRFVQGIPLTYRFEIQNTSGGTVYAFSGVPAGSGGTTTHIPTGGSLTADQTYRWRVRAEYQGLVGPWSELASFIAPASKGYISGNELYDPLINGETIGQISGPVTFIPGVGVKLETQLSYISYELPQTLTEGEFSILVTNLHENTEGGKTKLFAMGQGYGDIVVNDRRMTVEKRGDPPGIVAWRLITHGDQIDTEGAEREFVPFDPSDHYLWEASWRNNFFNVLIREGGANGQIIYSKGKHFEGRAYDPNPHVVYIGAPVGRSGPDGASVDGVIIRQVWVSGRPRPAFANQ